MSSSAATTGGSTPPGGPPGRTGPGLNGNWRNIGGVFPPGAPVAALSRNPNQMDLFICGNDGRVYTSFWTAGQDWSGLNDKWRDIGGVFPPGAPVAALSRNPNQMDLFICGNDGRVYTSFWTAGQDWSGLNDKWRNVGGAPLPDSWSVDSGTLTTSDANPASGNAQLTMTSAGDFTFKCHAHDAGFDNINYTIMSAYVTTETPPTEFTFQHSGTVHGTFSGGSRDDDWSPGTQTMPCSQSIGRRAGRNVAMRNRCRGRGRRKSLGGPSNVRSAEARASGGGSSDRIAPVTRSPGTIVEAADAELHRLIREGFEHGIPGEQLAEAAGLSVGRVYQIRDGRR